MRTSVPIRHLSFFVSTIFVLHTLLAVPALGQESSGKAAVGTDLLINYQGRLTDSAGEPVADTDHTIVFRLYDQATGGSPLWQETQNLETSNGVFSAQLGAVNSLDGLSFDQQYYLGLEVDGGDELTPRVQLTDAPYAVRAYSVSEDGVTNEAISNGAVTTSKLEDRSITTEKLDYAAVDSSRLEAGAVPKMLSPTLQLDTANDFVGINRDEALTGNEFFGVTAPVGNDVFGGMYVDTEGDEAWPFYGYASGSEAHAWHLYDHGEREWILEFDFTSPRFRLVVNEAGLVPGGDGDLTLGSSNHRWSEVHATNGTIQTSDRRLKAGIDSLSYGLAEILQLDPVSYHWKDASAEEASSAERHLGLIAQEVQNVIGEVVEKPNSDEGYLGMKYAELVPVLVRAIQQQQKIIEQQNSRLEQQEEALETQVNTLQRQIQELARQVEDDRSAHDQAVNTVSSE